MGLSTLQEGSAEDRLRLMFASYDRDKDGTLSKDEIYEIYRASLEARNEWRPASELQARHGQGWGGEREGEGAGVSRCVA